MKHYLYRVQIVEYPEGALLENPHYPGHLIENPGWQPEGWAPDEEWVERYGRHTGRDFYWPSTRREWRSRSSAMKRKQLIESYGAKAIIQRSAEIVWPEDGQEKVR
ncbi:hypothetical protein [Micromonospora sp. NPDC048169]|uniref:hypothetical protein n=1 Tax=Micromonospora sp. NPDC048169 TaxID=3154711 RepID=UPI0033ED6184